MTTTKLPKGIAHFTKSGKYRGQFRLSGTQYYTRLYLTPGAAKVARDELYRTVTDRLRGEPTLTAWGVAPGLSLGSAPFGDGPGPLPELPLHDLCSRRFRNETSRARAW